MTIALPLPVRLFVLGFDRGQFPELLSQSKRSPTTASPRSKTRLDVQP
jgi:hypothetical protein